MDKINICRRIRERIKKCIKPCPLLESYAHNCEVLCLQGTTMKPCKEFTMLIDLIIPPKRDKKDNKYFK